MKLLKVYFAVISLIKFSAFGQLPSIEWSKCYGGSSDEQAWSIIPLSNKYLIFGGTNSINGDVTGNHGGFDQWMFNIDSAGFLLQSKCYGGSQADVFISCLSLSNGNKLFYGGTSSNDGDVIGNHNPGVSDGWLVLADSLDSILWQKCYGGSNADGFNDLKKTNDGGYIVVGFTGSNDGDVSGNHNPTNFYTDIWVVKLDSLFNIQWQKCLGGTENEDSRNIYLMADGGYLVTGFSFSYDGDISNNIGLMDFWIVKIDSIGNKQWDKSLGGSQIDLLEASLQLVEGNFILAGRTESNDFDVSGNHGYEDVWVIKIDSSGNLIWQKCFGGSRSDEGRSVFESFNNSLIVVGRTNSNDGDVSGNHLGGCGPFPCDDAWIINVDSAGDLIWQKCFGGSYHDIANGVRQLNDSNYLITGSSESFDGDLTLANNHGGIDIWILKLSMGNLDINDQSIPITELSVYLNHINKRLNLRFFSNNKEKTNMQLLDITGKEILHQTITVTSGFNKHDFYTGELTGGVYMVRLIGERWSSVKRVIKD